MLSRSAERLYWLARYLERTENTAKLISVYMNLLMDMPRGVEMGWKQLIRINGSEQAFSENHKITNERTVIRFLLAEENHLGSIISSLRAARENIRTTRELLPDEAWEQVNEMYLYAKNNLHTVGSRRDRVLFLNEILKGCQRFTGLLSGYMSHNHPYRFIRLGRNLERADMTSRILDLASLLLSDSRSNELRQYETILWMNILSALNALLMYRQQVRSRIRGDDVLAFLLQDPDLPRSISCCLAEMTDSLTRLPNHNGLPVEVAKLSEYVQGINTHNTTQAQLRIILDGLQDRLGTLHNHISDSWFQRHA